jgi:hypothetical protein
VLERELERCECESARGQHDRDEDEAATPAHGLLRRDVGGRVEDPGRTREADGARQPQDGDRGHRSGNHEPEDQREEIGGAVARAARERQPQQREPRHRRRCSRPLRRVECSAGEREHDHSSGRSGLDERQRREPERDHVRRPAGEAESETGEPDPPAGQGAGRAQRAPERQSREPRRLTVLQREPASDRAGGREPEQQPGGGPGGHRPVARVWNGR